MLTIFTTRGTYNANEAQGDTLEELRATLIEEAFKYNRTETIAHDFADHIEAVYPTDPSEIDEDETPTTPADTVTRDDITAMAAKIWDVPEHFIEWREPNDESTAKPVTRAELQATQHHLGVTLRELATLLNVGERTLRGWISGRSPIPAGITYDLLELRTEHDTELAELVTKVNRGVIITYPEEPAEQLFPHRPIGWERRLCQRALIEHNITLEFDEDC